MGNRTERTEKYCFAQRNGSSGVFMGEKRGGGEGSDAPFWVPAFLQLSTPRTTLPASSADCLGSRGSADGTGGTIGAGLAIVRQAQLSERSGGRCWNITSRAR